MFALKLKSREKLEEAMNRRTFAVKCFGCKEVHFPEKEIDDFLTEKKPGEIKRLDYLCREEFSRAYLEKFSGAIKESSNVAVFSCGAGIQTIAGILEEKEVFPGCDTFYLNGFQGIKSLEADCLQCAECRLNQTGGICPLTACSKSLVNGPCGGADGGKCEVNREMNCGWELIYKRMKDLGKEESLSLQSRPRDFHKMILDYSSTGEKES